jgi:hypothetical protein
MQPLGEFLSVVLRSFAVVLPIALAVAAAVYALGGDEADSSATSRVSLTREVEWPFYDAARERGLSTLRSEEFEAALAARLGRPVDLALESPEDQTFILITATADTEAAAVEAANSAADLLVETDQARLAQSAQSDLDQATGLMSTVADRVERRRAERNQVDEDLEAAREALTEAQTNGDATAALRRDVDDLEARRSTLSNIINEESRRLVALELDVDAAQAAVESITPEIEVLGRPGATDNNGGNRLRSAAAAYVAVMVLGGALALLADRLWGRVRSPWYANQLAQVPVLADFTVPGPVEVHLDELAGSVIGGAKRHGPLVALNSVGAATTEPLADDLHQWLQASGVRSVVVDLDNGEDGRDAGPGNDLPHPPLGTLAECAAAAPALRRRVGENGVALVPGDPLETDRFNRTLAMADCTVLVVNRVRVHKLQRAVARVTDRGVTVLGVVLR